MNIKNDFSNELLKRREISVIVEAEANPGFEKVKKDIAEHFKIDENLIVVKALRGNFGAYSFLIDAFIYKTEGDKEKIEPKEKIKGAKTKEAKSAQPAQPTKA